MGVQNTSLPFPSLTKLGWYLPHRVVWRLSEKIYLGVQCQIKNLLTIWLLFLLLLFISWTSLSKHWYVFIFNNSIMGTTSLRLSNLAFCFHGPSNLWVRGGCLQHSLKELAHRLKMGGRERKKQRGRWEQQRKRRRREKTGVQAAALSRGVEELQLKAPGGSCRPGGGKPLAHLLAILLPQDSNKTYLSSC